MDTSRLGVSEKEATVTNPLHPLLGQGGCAAHLKDPQVALHWQKSAPGVMTVAISVPPL